ncbi:MAG: DUF1566 domain-containing protein [Pseudomonadota bacterium]
MRSKNPLLLGLLCTPLFASGHALNDTGATSCADDSAADLPCGPQTAAYPGQDAEFGRDVELPDDSDGRAGFSMTRLDEFGEPLDEAEPDFASTPWRCVRDEVTGLIWEVKTDDGMLRDSGWTYSWFDSSLPASGLLQGFENGGSCSDSANCDTEKYVAAVNSQTLCGASDWRLPTRTELLGLVDFGADPMGVVMLGTYFPHGARDRYWAGNSNSFSDVTAWSVFFGSGSSLPTSKFEARRIRLVRSAP